MLRLSVALVGSVVFVACGSDTLREREPDEELIEEIDEIEAGQRIGPRVHTLSPGIDGPPVYFPFTQLISDPAEADPLVAALQAQGSTQVNVYDDVSREVYDFLFSATGSGSRRRAHPGSRRFEREAADR